jgi:hypothetical protein
MSLNYKCDNKIKKKEDKLSQQFQNLQAKYDEIKKRHTELIKRYRIIYKDNKQIKKRLSIVTDQNKKLMDEIKFLKLPAFIKKFIQDLNKIKSPFDMRAKLEKSRK